MNDLFSPMPRPERDAFASHYLAYLKRREGVPCFERRTLSRREETARALAARPVRWRGPLPVDPRVFQENLARCAPESGLDAATLWALAVAKGNRAERLGVEHKLDSRGFEPGGAEDPLTYVELQECDHTRLLLRVLEVIGLETEIGEPVGAMTRMGVRLLGSLPRGPLDVLALPFEVVGVSAFHALRMEARKLFAEQPDALARIDLHFARILVDEVGHVRYLRSRLPPAALALSRALLPFAKRALFNDNHEIRILLERRGDLPGIASVDIDALVADEPERLQALAA